MKKKVGFASGIGFVLASAGSAVGLGNLWGFPYKTSQNGGAAFVLVYIAFVILIGFFTMIAEMYIGKRTQSNTLTAYKKIHPNLGWAGLVAVVIPGLIACYYSVLGGWTLKYTVNSFSGNAGILPTFSVNTVEVIVFCFAFIFLSILIIMLGVEKGIEKMSKILMPSLLVIIIFIAIYCLCLGEGVSTGLEFYLKPDFSKLTFKNVLAAMGQAFYSLSLGMGIMITYGSYTGKEINISKSCALVCLFDTIIALLAGLAIFPAVAHFDPELMSSAKGVALIYIVLPQVFESMGFAGKIISFAFFTMTTIAAITSVISLIEVVNQFVLQKFRLKRVTSSLIVASICFIISIPVSISLGHVGILEEESPALFGLDFLTFLDEVTNTVLMPVGALIACLTVGWIIKPEKAINELEELGSPLPKLMKKVFPVTIKFITPGLILLVEIGGLIDEVKAGNFFVIFFSAVLIATCIGEYFAAFRNKDTGSNEDEK